MDIVLIILGFFLLVVGFLGTFVPVLPGAPLAWAGLLIMNFSNHVEFSMVSLVITAIVAIVVSVVDNFLPVIFTKQSGGSKAGTVGSTVGLIAGLFVGPIGIILGPFLGAFVGELINDNSDTHKAFLAALGSFKGFLFGTGLKMIAVVVFIWIAIQSLG